MAEQRAKLDGVRIDGVRTQKKPESTEWSRWRLLRVANRAVFGAVWLWTGTIVGDDICNVRSPPLKCFYCIKQMYFLHKMPLPSENM